MNPQEPAGGEGGKGKSAESVIWAQMVDGPVGKTRGTVCGEPQVRYPLTELYAKGVLTVGRSVPLSTFSFAKRTIKVKYGGHTL